MAKLYVCKTCGYHNKPRKFSKGSIGMEIILWIFFIVPGVFYSLWRITSRYNGCPICKSADIIPDDSPLAQEILRKK